MMYFRGVVATTVWVELLALGARSELFLTRREYESFERECSATERAEVLEVVQRSQATREQIFWSDTLREPRERVLVVEVPEQWTTFGHFVTTLAGKRAAGLRVAGATKRALFYKNCAYPGDPDAITGMEPVKSHGVHLHNCRDGFIDFEQFFGLPNRTAVAWPRNRTLPRLSRVLHDADAASVVSNPAVAITMTVWTAVKLAAEFDELSRDARPRRKKRRPLYDCYLFATTRPIGDVWNHLTRTAKEINAVDDILGLHLRTGYADHGKKMDDPVNAKTGRIEVLSQFSVTYPDLLHQSRQLPRGSKQWMDLDFAAFSSRRFPGADDILACKRPLFELLALSQTIDCLDKWANNSGVVLATDHATYYTVMTSLVHKSTLLVPERVLRKESSDTHGHFYHTSSFALNRGNKRQKLKVETRVDWQALGVTAAIELHLLTFCDLLVVYGPSMYQRAANRLAINPDFQLVTLNMGAPGQVDDPTFKLIDRFCKKGCYTRLACDCSRTPTAGEFHLKHKGYIPH